MIFLPNLDITIPVMSSMIEMEEVVPGEVGGKQPYASSPASIGIPGGGNIVPFTVTLHSGKSDLPLDMKYGSKGLPGANTEMTQRPRQEDCRKKETRPVR